MYKHGRPFKYDPSHKCGSCPPNKAGHYRIKNKSGNIMYVGETNNLSRRMTEHRCAGKLKRGETFEFKIADGRSTPKTRREHERLKIQQHNPFRNSSSGGEGRIPY